MEKRKIEEEANEAQDIKQEKENLFKNFQKRLKNDSSALPVSPQQKPRTVQIQPILKQPETTRPTVKETIKSKYEEMPESGKFKTAFLSNGKQLYFKQKPPKSLEKYKETEKSDENLLSKPIYELLNEIQVEKEFKIETSEFNDLNNETELWVEKYKPQKFIDLLGDVKVNENCLVWLNQWGKCVFNKKSKQPISNSSSSNRFNQNQFSSNTSNPTPHFNSNNSSNNLTVSHLKDPLDRPDHKILLLHGPPGIGKTTLAHSLAKQLGYNAIEINASDERQSGVLKEKVFGALFSKSECFNKKPNLVILDEIDGVPGSWFINSLVKLAGNSTTVTKKGKKGKNKRTLMRPIICICNDLYVPALRELRQVSMVYQVRETPQRLMRNKLKAIFESEIKNLSLNVKVDNKVYSLIVEESEGDWRVCLNSLQLLFNKIKSREGSKVGCDDLVDILSCKDKTKNMYYTLEKVFNFNQSEVLSEFGSNGSFSQLYGILKGDDDRVLNGCFETYLKCFIRDREFGFSYLKLYDYLNLFDSISGFGSGGVNALIGMQYQYLPYIVGAFHGYCKNVSNVRCITGNQQTNNKFGNVVRLNYPKVDYESRVVKKTCINIFRSFIDGLNGVSMRSWLSDCNLFCNFALSYLLKILSPSIKCLNLHLMKGEEKERFDRVCLLFACLGVNYRQQFISNNDKNIVNSGEKYESLDKLLGFMDDGKKVLVGDYGVKQMISFEVEQKRIQLFSVSSKSGGKEPKENDEKSETKNANDSKKSVQENKKNAVQTSLKIKNVKPKKVTKDFFGRVVPDNKVKEDKSKKEKYKVRYQYFEGYSNAVKRNLKMSDILKGLK